MRVDVNRWLIDGRTSVDEVHERLGIELPEGEYVTLGGFLFDGFGHIPIEGEQLPVDGWELRVVELEKRRIAKVLAKHRWPAETATPTRDRAPLRRARRADGGRARSPGAARSARLTAPPGT